MAAVVIIVMLPVPGAVTADAGAVQLPCGIEAVQESVTAPVKPPTPETVTAIMPLVPRVTEIGCALMVKSHAVPLTVTVCGLPSALSAMESVAEREPLAPVGGVNVRLITQVPFGATAAPLLQVLPVAIAKSDAFVPPREGAAVMFSVAVPVFSPLRNADHRRKTGSAWQTGAVALRPAIMVYATDKAALSAPTAVGVNVTPIPQDAHAQNRGRARKPRGRTLRPRQRNPGVRSRRCGG